MTKKDLIDKYKISSERACFVDGNRQKIRSQDFHILYGLNVPSPELSAMNQMIAENPNWKPIYWQQQGACSNWGYYLERDETDAEMEARIQKEIIESETKSLEKFKIISSAKEKYPFCFE